MKTLPSENTFYFYRGRVALYALLRAMNLQPGDEVLIPGFTCGAVPAPILGMRAGPVYVDTNPGTYNIDPVELERKITNRSRVIVAQHTFGIPCDMSAIMSVAQRHGLAVIEDTCHVWGSKYKGMDLGSIGDAAFYSYDPGKPFIIGMGGAATVNSESLLSKLSQIYPAFRKPDAIETVKLHIQYLAYCATRHPRLFWYVRDLYRYLSKSGVAVATWPADSLEGTLGPDYDKGLSPSLKARLLAMMKKGNRVVDRHTRIAAYYDRALRSLGTSVLRSDADCDPVLICYPLQVTNKTRLLQEARIAKIELGDSFLSPVHPLPEAHWASVGYEKGSCPSGEAVASQVVTLPCRAGVTEREVHRTVGFLSKMKQRGLLREAAPEDMAFANQ